MKNFILITFSLFLTSAFAETGRPQPAQPQPQPQPAQLTAPRRQLAEIGSLVIEPSWWKAKDYRWQVGYENAATNSTGILGQNVMTGGYWFNESWGLDVYLGYSKSANGNTESISDTTNTVATPNTKTTTTSYSGTNTSRSLAIAGGLKHRLYQSDWFQLNIGLVAAFFPSGTADYNTGSKTETFADAGNTANKTVTETALGTISSNTSSQFSIGPRLGTEFYIKWFPHLAVGFATGVLTSLSGETTTTTDTVTRTYTVVSGVDQTPTASSTTHTVATTKAGFRGTTFGLGGTTFAFTGTFSIRYVF